MPEHAGRLVSGRYRLESRLGRGASGVVWRARDERLGRSVAIKEVPAVLAVRDGDEHAGRRRVLREARAAARLSHPSVTQIYDVVSDDEVVHLVMEYVDAPTLRDVVRERGPLPPAEVAALGLALLDALSAAHRAGIVHRDVKPANVLVCADGTPKLTDFGIASLTGDATVTATGLIVGSPSFMAPEQASGATVGPAADLWSLGATLWYAVEGVGPFDREGPVPTVAAVLHAPTPRPVRAGALAPALQAALRKDPSERADAQQLGALLAGAAGQPAPATAPPPAPPTRPLAPRRRPGVARLPRAAGLAAGALAATGLLAAALGLVLRAPPDEAADAPAAPAPPTATAPETPAVATERVEIGATGATVGVPAGWQPQARSDTITDYVDPEGGRFLRLDWTDAPRADPVVAWQELSASLAANRDGYEELGIEPVRVAELPAALWEYRLVVDGETRRAYNLGIAGPDFGWALNLQVAAEQWDESQVLWRVIMESFEPSP